MLFYAASGAGKTSLLNASLLAALEREGFEALPPARVRAPLEAAADEPRNVYEASVLAHLAPLLHESADALSLKELLAAIPHGEDADGFASPRVLVIDQFEELFSAYPDKWQQRPGFFDALAEAVDDDPLLRVVLAIREDYLAQLDPFAKQLPDGLRGRYRLERLGPEAAHRAVTAPLAGTGRSYDAGVAEALIEDLLQVRVDTGDGKTVSVRGEYVEPVALQVACRSLWEALPAEVMLITEEHRSRFGNVDEVLGGFYDQAVAAAASAAHMREGELRSRFERAFVTPLGTRGTVVSGQKETAGIPAAAIKELDRRHLIRAELRAGARWYELTHDRLIEPLRTSNRRRAARIRRRRARDGGIAMGALLVAAAAAVITLVFTGGSDQAKTRTVVSGRAGAQALNAIIPVPGGVIGAPWLTADGRRVSAFGADGTAQVWTTAGLDVWQLGAATEAATPLTVMAVSPATAGNTTVVLVGGPGGVKLFRVRDVNSQTPVDVAAPASPSALTFSNDGRHIALGYGDGSVRVFAVAAPTVPVLVIPPPSTPSAVVGLAFSPSANELAVQRLHDVQVFQLSPLSSLRTFGVENSRSVAWLDGETVVVAPDSGDIQVRTTHRAHTGKLEHADAVATTPERGLVALAFSGKPIRLFDRDGKLVQTLPAETAPTTALAFSPDGTALAAGERDGSIQLYALPSGRPTTLLGHRGAITGLSFSANGAYLASTARDETIRTWRALPDLAVNVRVDRKAATITAFIANRGAVGAPSVPIATYVAGKLVDSGRTDPVAAGARRTYKLELAGGPIAASADIRVVIDPEHTLAEADRTNDTVVVAVAPEPGGGQATSVRDRIVAAAQLAVRKAASIHYSFGPQRMQGVLNHVRPPNVPKYADSSSFVTWCYWAAGAPDPNGSGYNGVGYTGTLATHGETVTSPKPGDVVLYGAGSVPRIAGIFIGHGKVIVNGNEAGPNVRPLDFTSPKVVHRYVGAHSVTVG